VNRYIEPRTIPRFTIHQSPRPVQQNAWLETKVPRPISCQAGPCFAPLTLYVQPRSRKNKSKTGTGIPKSHSKMYPVAPACSIFSFNLIPLCPPSFIILFAGETASGRVEKEKKSALVRRVGVAQASCLWGQRASGLLLSFLLLSTSRMLVGPTGKMPVLRSSSVTPYGKIGRGQLQFFALGRLRAIGAII